MQTQYTTQSGSVYVRTVSDGGDCWHKQAPDGGRVPLAGGMHLSRRRLKTLITDYPVTAMDRTACFGEGVAKEFFDDAQRENAVAVPAGEESTIFFLVDRGLGQFGIGHSSRVVKVDAGSGEPVDTVSATAI